MTRRLAALTLLVLAAACGSDGENDDQGSTAAPTDEERTDEAAVVPEDVDVCGLLSDDEVETIMGVAPFGSGFASDDEGRFICEWESDPTDRANYRYVVVGVEPLENAIEGYDDLETYLDEATNVEVREVDDVGDEAFAELFNNSLIGVDVVVGDTLFTLALQTREPVEPDTPEYEDVIELASELPARAA